MAVVAALSSPGAGRGSVPEWLRAAARATPPAYSAETEAVVLLDEGVTVVKDNGDIETTSRRAIRILRPDGRHYGTRSVFFDNETRLTYLKGWSIAANGDEYEVKEKDAVERAVYDGVSLYSDNRLKRLVLPAVEAGAVVGFESVQKVRPTINQVTWNLHENIPVLRSHFTFKLPAGWEYGATWMNYPVQEATATSANEWTWEFQNLPAIEPEPSMPAWETLAGRLALTFYSGGKEASNKSHRSWRDIGQWYASLAADRRGLTPAIQAKTRELIAPAKDTLGKIEALARFAQRDIRYVSIQIGIGGHQPHFAGDIFANLYGDCKDKATLLSTMLREAGIESYYVLIHTDRGTVAPQFPTLTFNHVILAIRLPQDVNGTNLYTIIEHPRLGRLLYFDPTDSDTSLGTLRSDLQDNDGLLVTEEGGELVHLPLLPPALNRLLRSGKMTVGPDGSLTGSMQEIRWGDHARRFRSRLIDAPASERTRMIEEILGAQFGGVAYQSVAIEGLEETGKPLVLSYQFRAVNYAKLAGNLLLVRPRVIGQKSSDVLEWKERKNPIEFKASSLETDMFDIALPTGYQIDEIPPPLTADCGFADYKSTIKLEGNVLKYQRSLAIKSLHVPKDRLGELKTFYRQIAGDERNSAVLKRLAP